MSELPGGWVEATLDELVTSNGVVRDGDWVESKDQDPNGEVRLTQLADVGEGEFRNRSDRYLNLETAEQLGCTFLEPGDVLIARMPDPIGRACIFPGLSQPAVTVVDVLIFRSGSDFVSPHWIMSAVNAPETRQKIIAQASGTTRQRISGGNLKRLPLPLPPLAEQRRIVAKLDALNAKSDRARTELARIESLVSRYKQAVLSKAFSGELTSVQFAEAEGDRRLSHPPHWKQMQLGEIAEIKSGITLGKKRKPDEELLELPYLRVANVQRGWLDLREIKTIEVTAKEADGLFLREGDVLMNEGGDRDKLGRGWVWDGQIHDCIHQNHVFRVRLASDTVPPRFLSYYANEFGQKHFFDEGKQTTNLASISKSKLSAMTVPVPPFEDATEIVRRIESAFAKIDRLANEAKRALELVGRLDEAILAKAFRGELVPQDENDEPASLLLDRIKEVRSDEPSRPKRRRSATKGKVHDMARTIIEALAEAKDWLAAQELFARCGVRDGSSTEDVEKLYRQLLDLERQDKVEIEELSDPMTGAKQSNRVRLRK